MTKPNSADGSYILVKGYAIEPTTFINFRDNTTGLTDEAILKSVRYVAPDSPDSPLSRNGLLNGINDLSRIPGMQCRVAIWPDKVCSVLSFPVALRKPRKLQLIRAYRNARHAMRAVEFNELNVPEGLA